MRSPRIIDRKCVGCGIVDQVPIGAKHYTTGKWVGEWQDDDTINWFHKTCYPDMDKYVQQSQLGDQRMGNGE